MNQSTKGEMVFDTLIKFSKGREKLIFMLLIKG